jgi:hypothetical protein
MPKAETGFERQKKREGLQGPAVDARRQREDLLVARGVVRRVVRRAVPRGQRAHAHYQGLTLTLTP